MLLPLLFYVIKEQGIFDENRSQDKRKGVSYIKQPEGRSLGITPNFHVGGWGRDLDRGCKEFRGWENFYRFILQISS